jgi:hypothetical protein
VRAIKLVLSRKGFDSANGGIPSPIFPDGRLLSLPIPATSSPTRFADYRWGDQNVGTLVASLTSGKVVAQHPHISTRTSTRAPARGPWAGEHQPGRLRGCPLSEQRRRQVSLA